MNHNTHVPQMQEHRARLCAQIRDALAGDDLDAPTLSDDALTRAAYQLLYVMWERGWGPMQQDSWERAARALRQMQAVQGGAA